MLPITTRVDHDAFGRRVGLSNGYIFHVKQNLDLAIVDAQVEVLAIGDVAERVNVGFEKRGGPVHADSARVVLDQGHFGELYSVAEHNVY